MGKMGQQPLKLGRRVQSLGSLLAMAEAWLIWPFVLGSASYPRFFNPRPTPSRLINLLNLSVTRRRRPTATPYNRSGK